MKLSDIPSLLLVNGGKELRASALKLHNYAVVNGLGTGDMGAKVEAFWKDQGALLKKDTGLPSDGLFLGLGVPDIRMDCYKALSYVRMSVKRGDTDAGKSWEQFCDFLATEAAKTGGGGTGPVKITVGKSEVFLAKSGSKSAEYAMEVLNDQKGGFVVDFFNARVPYMVEPKGTKVTFKFDIPEGVGHAGESEGEILFRSGTTAGEGKVILTAGDAEAVIKFTSADRGLSTESIADMKVGEQVSIDVEAFINPYQGDPKNKRILAKLSDKDVIVISDATHVNAVGSGYARVYGLVEYESAPGLTWADRSGVTVVDPAKATAVRNNVLHNVEE